MGQEMSENYKGLNTFPIIRNFNAIQTWTNVSLPGKAIMITVGCEQHDIYVSFEGTEGGATSGVHKIFIKAGGYMSINRGRGTNQHSNIQIATKSSSSAEVTLIFEE
jgi:hypothetical protein